MIMYKTKKLLLSPAFFTVAIEIHFMIQKNKTMLGRQALLKFLYDGVEDLDGSSAGPAYEMVVMLASVDPFITHDTVSEVDLPGQPCFAQKLQDPVDRGLADGSVSFLHDIVEFLRGDVFFPFQVLVQNKVSLRRFAQAFPGQEIFENLFFRFHGPQFPIMIIILSNDSYKR